MIFFAFYLRLFFICKYFEPVNQQQTFSNKTCLCIINRHLCTISSEDKKFIIRIDSSYIHGLSEIVVSLYSSLGTFFIANKKCVILSVHYRIYVLIITGISPTASLIADLKAIAGDDSRYLQVSSAEELYPQFNTLFNNIAVCPDLSFEPMTLGKICFCHSTDNFIW